MLDKSVSAADVEEAVERNEKIKSALSEFSRLHG